MLIHYRDKRVQNYPTSARTNKSTPIFQELISRVLLEIETRGQVFCIVLGPVTISIAIKTIGLLYLFYNTWVTFWTPEIVQRLDKLSKSVGSFGIRCGQGWVLGGLTGTISSWAVPEKTARNTRKMWFWGIKTTNCRPGHFHTFYSWQIFEIFVIHS